MAHILVVCTANICRSPVGEALLRQRLHERGLESWTVSSSGTWAQVERKAAHYSIKLMSERGYDLKQHRASMIEDDDLQAADLVLCMESGHVEALKAEFPSYADRIYLISEMVGKRYNIQDPYRRSKDTYQQMIVELTNIIETGLDRIIALAEENAAKNRS